MRAVIPLGLAIATTLFLAIKGEWIGLSIFLGCMAFTIFVLRQLNK